MQSILHAVMDNLRRLRQKITDRRIFSQRAFNWLPGLDGSSLNVVESPINPRILIQDMSSDDFDWYLMIYPEYIREVYEEVEIERFDNIPVTLGSLRKGQSRCLTGANLQDMDKWMRKRGTPLPINFHNRTTDLVDSNREETVKRITSEAFSMYEDELKRQEISSGEAAWAAMNHLRKLAGIGNSRACLLLSVAYPKTVAYCSRALFRWTLGEGYSPEQQLLKQDYLAIFKELEKITGKFAGKSAVDVEKVAHVLECREQIENSKEVCLKQDIISNKQPESSGANGEVYKVEGNQLHFKGRNENHGYVAIKKAQYRKRHEERQIFLNEITISRELCKGYPQHFIEFLGWNEDRDNLYIAMEYAEHGDLERMLKFRVNDWSWSEAHMRTVTEQILQGLKYMHGEMIAHRDLKPKNVLVTSLHKINVKIADFGIAKRLSKRGTTSLRTITGSQGYRAPEVLKIWNKGDRRGYTYNVDLWSLGCIVYRMARGSPLFESDQEIIRSERRVKEKIKKETNQLTERKPVDPSRISDGIHISNSGVLFIQALLVVNAKERPGSAEEALKELQKWSESPIEEEAD